MSTHWTEAQIEAMLELDGLGQTLITEDQMAKRAQDEMPAVQKGCICPNGHQADEYGYIVTSPSCQLHGCRSRFVPMSRMTQNSARTVGVIHSRNHGSS